MRGGGGILTLGAPIMDGAAVPVLGGKGGGGLFSCIIIFWVVLGFVVLSLSFDAQRRHALSLALSFI